MTHLTEFAPLYEVRVLLEVVGNHFAGLLTHHVVQMEHLIDTARSLVPCRHRPSIPYNEMKELSNILQYIVGSCSTVLYIVAYCRILSYILVFCQRKLGSNLPSYE